MRSLSSIGLGLSVVFTCLLLFLFAEIYYLLWWKRRIIRREIDGYNGNPTREFLFLFCWKNKNLPTSSINPTNTPQTNQSDHYQDFQFHTNNKDNLVQPINETNMETHLVIGPPRFLFPIEEETKEDLESEDGKSRGEGKRCLSDLLKRIETPYITPLSSPLTTPMGSRNSTSSSGFNPFNEASSDAEFNKMIKTSPPPTFKFLRDAEDKLQKKIKMMEETSKINNNDGVILHKEDASFITIIVANNNNEFDKTNHHYHSPHCPSTSSSSSIASTCCSQVLPLTSSSSLPKQMVNCSKTIK